MRKHEQFVWRRRLDVLSPFPRRRSPFFLPRSRLIFVVPSLFVNDLFLPMVLLLHLLFHTQACHPHLCPLLSSSRRFSLFLLLSRRSRRVMLHVALFPHCSPPFDGLFRIRGVGIRRWRLRLDLDLDDAFGCNLLTLDLNGWFRGRKIQL